MTDTAPGFLHSAKRLAAALRRETALARTGALRELAAAGLAKRDAFANFRLACAAHPPGAAEQAALRDVLDAANESSLVLEAVHSTLADLAARLRAAVRAASEPATYDPAAAPVRHVLPVQLDDRA